MPTSAARVSWMRSFSFLAWRRSRSIFRFSCFLVDSSFSRRLNTLVSMTTPSIPGGALREASRTSPAFSPKIARSSRSSGVRSVSPLGVTFPTRMSPAFTWAPMRMMPSSSRFLTASSLTFGISRVISSAPRFVSRTCSSNSSMWIEVKRSSLIRRSETRMASSKLYPPHGMKATSTLAPSASSPFLVAAPSARSCPRFTRSPSETSGRWLMQVSWLLRLNFVSL